MEKLFKEYAEFLMKQALDDSLFHKASDEEKQTIETSIRNAIQSYEQEDFISFIDNLLNLYKVQTDIFPEEFHPLHVDFFTDRAMWDWVMEASNKNEQEISKFDWDAAGYIVRDLQERLDKNEIFKSEEAMVVQ